MPRFLALVFCSLLVGCPATGDDDDVSNDDDATGDDDDATADLSRPVTLAGGCTMADRYGVFAVEGQELFGVAEGTFADGVVPVTILEELTASGPCRLLRRNNPFCDPACSPGQTCDHDGTCIPFPENQDLGRLQVAGLGQFLELDPVEPGNRYFGLGLPNPPFAAGAEVRLDAVTEGLELEGVGSDELVIPESPLLVEEQTDLTVTWDAPVTVTDARIHLELTIDQHGVSPVRVQCTFDDDGAAVVTSDLVDALFAAGVSGYPNAQLARRTTDSAAFLDGCVELRVGSIRQPDVRVSGHTPCSGPGDCPDGLECDLPTNTCI